uniref:Uncharacterized protein n=1 Tax=Vitis vinifera TaxID=29760 RepID=F6HMM5_VITVI
MPYLYSLLWGLQTCPKSGPAFKRNKKKKALIRVIMNSGANQGMEHGVLSLITSETLQLFR